jgi:uncharacterized DUF497 family protein
MKITFDPAQRAATLRERGLDFTDAEAVFGGVTATAPDIRFDYGEERMISAGYLRGRMVVIVWTARGNARHVISMRYCHEEEEERWLARMGQS